MTATLPASVRHAAAKATPNFDWLVPMKNFFSLREVAAILEVSENFVEKLFDAGKQLSGHEYNGGTGQRMTKRVSRAWVITLLVTSARYDADTKFDALLTCLRELNGHELLKLSEEARRLAVQKGVR